MKRYLGDVAFTLVALLLAWALARLFVNGPSYTDSFYHLSVARNLYTGDGFADHFLWTYLDAPDSLPAPSHRYWMPLTSALAALGMTMFAAPDNFVAAQLPFVLATTGTGMVAHHLALTMGGRRRQAWVAGVITITGGFFAPRWGAIDTFAPYALLGSLCLLWIAKGAQAEENRFLHVALSGILAGLCHLTRPDGVLMLLIALLVYLGASSGRPAGRSRTRLDRGRCAALVLACYLLTMLPWFLRNLNTIDMILPAGAIRAIWFRDYDDLFNYPNDASPSDLFADGIETFVRTRAIGVVNGIGTFVAVEGLIVLTPFMLIGLWRRRGHSLLGGFWLFAIAIHLTMCLVFPLPGYRGGLFHAVAALFPIWMVLGVLGLDDAIDWIAKRRRSWNHAYTKPLFAMTVLLIGASLSVAVGFRSGQGRAPALPPALVEVRAALPKDARIMINDPARLYYQLGMTGVSLPNESVEVALEIAAKYDVDYMLLENVSADGIAHAVPRKLQFDLDHPPAFLRQIPLPGQPQLRLYEFVHGQSKTS